MEQQGVLGSEAWHFSSSRNLTLNPLLESTCARSNNLTPTQPYCSHAILPTRLKEQGPKHGMKQSCYCCKLLGFQGTVRDPHLQSPAVQPSNKDILQIMAGMGESSKLPDCSPLKRTRGCNEPHAPPETWDELPHTYKNSDPTVAAAGLPTLRNLGEHLAVKVLHKG